MSYEKLNSDIKDAMKARDKELLAVLRTLKGMCDTSAVLKDGQKVISDDLVVAKAKSLSKTAQTNLEIDNLPNAAIIENQFTVETMKRYIPQSASYEDTVALIEEYIAAGASSMKDVMPKLKQSGIAIDMKMASGIVKEKLG